ncbi:MAG: hypothetical protein K1W22_01770 [Lachnospiraceae bacterium]
MVEVKEIEWKKREELCKGIARLGLSDEEAKEIFEYLEDECVIEITPPQTEEDALQYVQIQSSPTGRMEAKSYKPGNIILNIKEATANSLGAGFSTAAAIGAVSSSQPVIAILTILGAVLAAASLCRIVLEDNAALILAVLWRYWNNHTLIDAETGLKRVNEYLASCDREELSKVQYNDLLEDLENIKCIVLDNGKIKLNERVHVKY